MQPSGLRMQGPPYEEGGKAQTVDLTVHKMFFSLVLLCFVIILVLTSVLTQIPTSELTPLTVFSILVLL